MLFLFESVFFVVILMSYVNAYPTGAPQEVCEHLMPKHKAQPQTGESPYLVSAVIEKSLSGVNEVNITISSPEGTPFRGFVIQARMASNLSTTIDGKFKVIDEQNSHSASCSGGINNTLTHSNRKDKQVITAKWLAPENLNNEIVFLATIVKETKIFWINQLSKPISMNFLSVNQDSVPHQSTHQPHHHQQNELNPATTEQPLGGTKNELSNTSSLNYLNFLTLITVFSCYLFN